MVKQRMKRIKLTQNKYAIVDDTDYELLSKHKWSICRARGKLYAVRSIRSSGKVLMHRFLMGLTANDKICIDHINGDGLDNRRDNLRIATLEQNQGNSKLRKDNTSGYKGISWHRNAKKWIVQLGNGKACILYGGLFTDKKEATKKYNEMARSKFGKFAKLNEI